MRRPGFPAPENSGVAARRIIGQAHQGAQKSRPHAVGPVALL
jgi:hypothetical protein